MRLATISENSSMVSSGICSKRGVGVPRIVSTFRGSRASHRGASLLASPSWLQRAAAFPGITGSVSTARALVSQRQLWITPCAFPGSAFVSFQGSLDWR